MITREAPLVVLDKTETLVGDCATLDSTQGSSLTGDVIDRLQFEQRYYSALPFMIGKGYGTTFANKKVTFSVKLQHGDSSGGGDMADYSTGQEPPSVVFQTSAETTPQRHWSTGMQRFYSSDRPYGLHGAKRYVRVVGTPLIAGGNTTSTADTNIIRTSLGVAFLTAEKAPFDFTCSTSTST